MDDLNFIISVVEMCLDSAECISDSYLSNISGKLTKKMFTSIAEELAVNKRCGYMRCRNHISDQIITQRYKIVKNCLYDLTERKNFCSDACYTFYSRVLDQLSEFATPATLFFPKVAEFENENQKIAIRPGEKLDLKNAAEMVKSLERLRLADQHEKQLLPGVHFEKPLNFEVAGHSEVMETSAHFSNDEILAPSIDSDSQSEIEDFDLDTPIQKCQPKVTKSTLNISLEHVREKYFDASSKIGLRLKRKIIPIIEPMSLKSVENIKQSVEHKVTEKELNFDHVKSVLLEWTSEEKPEKIIDENFSFDEAAFRTKVAALFEGRMLNSDSENDAPVDTGCAGNYAMPRVDSESQMRMRRKIVSEKFKAVLPRICKVLRLTVDDASNIIKPILPRLKFTAENINLSSNEWIICCIILLIRSDALKCQVKSNDEIHTFLGQLKCDLKDFYELCCCPIIKE